MAVHTAAAHSAPFTLENFCMKALPKGQEMGR